MPCPEPPEREPDPDREIDYAEWYRSANHRCIELLEELLKVRQELEKAVQARSHLQSAVDCFHGAVAALPMEQQARAEIKAAVALSNAVKGFLA